MARTSASEKPAPPPWRNSAFSPAATFSLSAGSCPENRAELLIQAFREVPRASGVKLVIVGDAPYSEEYKKELVALADDRVIFTGYAFLEDYRELSRHCLFYVLASGVEGTRPVLLDQMGFGNCVVVRDTLANSDVVAEAGIKFRDADEKTSLTERMTYLLENREVIEEYRVKAVQRMEEAFSWEVITDRYEGLFESWCASEVSN